ncbi:thioredoxin domain-containing protein [Formosa sp. PL04]|uniref:thioredoxin domain-containing protein n=1 Tax=Formosa sp. PL04 TaxID=3081755 RepID=UPI0029825A13|nr:thioredoxin domain-containing protein [Formosa sp. PL04]MDW5287902.1 thioredoxin domain-containing protein [Formosa sp. PL04]
MTSVIVLFTSIVSCQESTSTLTPEEFANMINKNPELIVIDVRTPKEFATGHLDNAINYDWKSDNFQNQIINLDKSKEVLVYCFSGARSAKAATKMRSEGFVSVMELNGGMINWRSKSLPEVGGEVASSGMSKQDFTDLLNSDKLILVDFYADWCAPCKKMEPYLKEIANDMKATVEVIRIDADKNKELCKTLGVDALPVLQLYKNKALIWDHSGFIEKEAVVKQLK